MTDVSNVDKLEKLKMKTKYLITRHARRLAVGLVAAVGIANALHAQQATPVNTIREESEMVQCITKVLVGK